MTEKLNMGTRGKQILNANGIAKKVAITVVAAVILGWTAWVTTNAMERIRYRAIGDPWTEVQALKQEIKLLTLISENQYQIRGLTALGGRLDKLEAHLTIISSDITEIKLAVARIQAKP